MAAPASKAKSRKKLILAVVAIAIIVVANRQFHNDNANRYRLGVLFQHPNSGDGQNLKLERF
jgi:hypothetical protein